MSQIFALLNLLQEKFRWTRAFCALLGKHMYSVLYHRKSALHWSLAQIQRQDQKSTLSVTSTENSHQQDLFSPRDLRNHNRAWKSSIRSLVQRLKPEQIDTLLTHCLLDPLIINRPQAVTNSSGGNFFASAPKAETTSEDLFISLFFSRQQFDQWMLCCQQCRHLIEQCRQDIAADPNALGAATTDELISERHRFSQYAISLSPIVDDCVNWLASLSAFLTDDRGVPTPLDFPSLPSALRQRLVKIGKESIDVWGMLHGATITESNDDGTNESPQDDPIEALTYDEMEQAVRDIQLSRTRGLTIQIDDQTVNLAEDSALKLAEANSRVETLKLPMRQVESLHDALEVVSPRPMQQTQRPHTAKR